MTTPLTDLTILAERYQAIAKRTPAKYRPAVQAVADLLDTAADFAHGLAAHQIPSRPYVDLGIDAPTATDDNGSPVIIYRDLRRYKTAPTSAVIAAIAERPDITAPELATLLGITYSTMITRLGQLRKRGVIVGHRVPMPGRPPRLAWRVVDAVAPTPGQLAIKQAALTYVAPEPLPDMPGNNDGDNERNNYADADILAILHKVPGADLNTIVMRLSASKSGMHQRLARMVADGLITRTDGRRPIRYYAAGEVTR